MWFYLSVILHFPRLGWDLGSLLKFPVVRIKEIVAALLQASDTFLIRSEPLTLGCTDPFSIPLASIFKSGCRKQSHRRGCLLHGVWLKVETAWVLDDECFWSPGKGHIDLSRRCTSKASGHILAWVSWPSWPKSPSLLVRDLWCPRFGALFWLQIEVLIGGWVYTYCSVYSSSDLLTYIWTQSPKCDMQNGNLTAL